MRNRIEVLLVEDNAGDVHLIRHALDTESFPVTIHVAADREQAMQRLATRRCALDLVILDLNLPNVSGLDPGTQSPTGSRRGVLFIHESR